MRDSHLFKHFWTLLALCGAMGLWGTVALGDAAMGARLSWSAHVVVFITFLAVLRGAGEILEREQTVAWVWREASRLALAAGFITCAGVGCVAVFTTFWASIGVIGMVPAEAAIAETPPAELLGPLYPIFAALAGGLGLLVAGHGYTHGWRALQRTDHSIPLRDLPAALDGLRVAHVSDFHLGPLLDRDDLRDVVDRILALDADVICITGDLVDSPFTDLDGWMPELARLQARHGVFAILGNHDRTSGADRVAASVARHTSIRLLRDARATLVIDGHRLHLVGLEDRAAAACTAALPALAADVPRDEPAILLAHHPRVFPDVVDAGFALTLAGHTHGGQVAFPGLPELNPARLLMTRYWIGWFEERGARIHVSRGVGTSGQRLRIAAPREITVITLRTPSDSD